MALTPLQVKDVCHGQAGIQNPWGWQSNGTCKYLTYDFVGKKYVALCMKKATGLIEEKLKKMGQRQRDEWKKMPDNCPGYRYMKHMDQGYDI